MRKQSVYLQRQRKECRQKKDDEQNVKSLYHMEIKIKKN